VVELTDINLDSFLIRELRSVVAKHPRFRELGGEIGSYFATMMRYNDLEIIIKNPTSDGNRLSSDHYMATQQGRVVAAKLEDKDGLFIEHIQEIDKTLKDPESGIYYFNLDSVDEANRSVVITCEKMKWVYGKVTNAVGTFIKLNAAIPSTDVGVRNMNAGEYCVANDRIYINVYKDIVSLYRISNDSNLIPLVDYWVELHEEPTITEATVSGVQVLKLPDTSYIQFEVVDQDDYILRRDLDYRISGSDIVLSNWTPANQKLRMVGTFKRDPNAAGYIASENSINFELVPGQTIQTEQFKAVASGKTYTYSDLVTGLDGRWYLNPLLQPGDNMSWECRVDLGQFEIKATKNALNVNFLPGIMVVIGDKTVVGDQSAMIVYPYVNETYEIYGSKENIRFDIDIRTNDMRTSSEIAGLIKEYLLVSGRERMETCGLTIYEASRSTNSEEKDGSGILSTQTVTLSISAAADWEVKKPLVTRLDTIDIENVSFDYSYPNKRVSINPIGTTYGSSRFLTSYY
jgi:hypothetical protein